MKTISILILLVSAHLTSLAQLEVYQIVLSGQDTAQILPIEDIRAFAYVTIKERQCRHELKTVNETLTLTEKSIEAKNNMIQSLEQTNSINSEIINAKNQVIIAKNKDIASHEKKVKKFKLITVAVSALLILAIIF